MRELIYFLIEDIFDPKKNGIVVQKLQFHKIYEKIINMQIASCHKHVL